MAMKSATITVGELAKHIDHSLLRPELTGDEVVEGCKVAVQCNVASVCVRPCDVRLAKELLKGKKRFITGRLEQTLGAASANVTYS